jgi:hypothetical protein
MYNFSLLLFPCSLIRARLDGQLISGLAFVHPLCTAWVPYIGFTSFAIFYFNTEYKIAERKADKAIVIE